MQTETKPKQVPIGTIYEVLEDNRWAFYLDNHLIQSYKFCPALYKYRNIDLIRRKGGSVGGAMGVGLWWSQVLENFYKGIAVEQDYYRNPLGPRNPPPPADKSFMLKCASDAWNDLKMESWKDFDLKGYEKFNGWKGALIMANAYFDSQAEIDKRMFTILGAEKGFGRCREILVGENDFVKVYWMGRPDLVVIENSTQTILPLDHKTVHVIDKNIQRKYKPNAQITGYVYAVACLAKELGFNKTPDRCIVNVAARTIPTDKPKDGVPRSRFTRVYPTFSLEELNEWRSDTVVWATALRKSYEANKWPLTSTPVTCHLYGGCEYRGIDSVTPSSRPQVIASDFVKVDPWAVYQNEDDEGEL
jgi:hypothetical protein